MKTNGYEDMNIRRRELGFNEYTYDNTKKNDDENEKKK